MTSQIKCCESHSAHGQLLRRCLKELNTFKIRNTSNMFWELRQSLIVLMFTYVHIEKYQRIRKYILQNV